MILAVLAGGIVAASCYSERLPPPAFRYRCDLDEDCDETERCVRNLCQIPCITGADCPARLYAGCVNGSCATLCQLADASCPSPQSCLDLGPLLGEQDSSDEAPMVGVCTESCRETGCQEGNVCVLDFCFAACGADTPCPTLDAACYQGACLPRSVIPEDAESSSGDGGRGETEAETTTGESSETSEGAS